MVDFWFNHFNIYEDKGIDRALVASFERDAIRPNVFGNFRTMLGATAKHPAMLFYLDNWMSTVAGYAGSEKNRRRGYQFPAKKSFSGLNENYARELMELHTLGVDGGYTQRDVTELARIFTGWGFVQKDLMRYNQGFVFQADAHDRGRKFWLGREITSSGQSEGEMALDILATHPATAQHLSFKLAQYFVNDRPPADLVNRMAQRFLDSKGEIRPVLELLFTSPEFFDEKISVASLKRHINMFCRACALRMSRSTTINLS